MTTRLELTQTWLDSAFGILADNLHGLTLQEALFVPPGGYRSILGTLKHTAAWSHVYRSYAFEPTPTSWPGVAWPHGLRDTVVPSDAYLADVIAWLQLADQLWQQDLSRIQDADLDLLRPVHWRELRPLLDTVCRVAYHYVYHAGEINQLLSICRQEAWEEGEEVEENLIPSDGHRVVPPWRR